MSMLYKTTMAAALALALVAVAQERAAARADEDKPHSKEEVMELLKKGISTAKEVKKHVHFKGDGTLDFAKAIVLDGIEGKPVPETSKGKIFPHYLVTTTKGEKFKVKFKRDGKNMDVTITKEASSKGK